MNGIQEVEGSIPFSSTILFMYVCAMKLQPCLDLHCGVRAKWVVPRTFSPLSASAVRGFLLIVSLVGRKNVGTILGGEPCATSISLKKSREKWQKKWEADGAYRVTEDPAKPTYYLLEMLPYSFRADPHGGMCATTPSVTSSPGTGGCADGTCSIPWGGTLSGSRRRTQPSSTAGIRRSGPRATFTT